VTAADLIHKPYRIEELALRIRAVLDREARVA
jgi:DNA-binding response OmpR family regulator